jgi:hypothetical protein
MPLNISRPSADASDSMALYEKLRAMTVDGDGTYSDQDLTNLMIGGLFNIVAKLEAQADSE